ncbi:hypothetical protein AGMMS50256_36440 [Betaproteobacteria bacterium]|nr:hypothetical protein AGMMS50256_36440 [Betaproteobacteria bacterium]
MKTRFVLILSLSLGFFSAGAVQAGDAALGAIVGGGLGAVIGNHVSGSNGAVIGGAFGAVTGAIIASDGRRTRHRDVYYRDTSYYYAPRPVYYAPTSVYVPEPAYRSTRVYHRAPHHGVHRLTPPPRNHGRNERLSRREIHRR